MKKNNYGISKLIIAHRFDRFCNFVLMKTFPLIGGNDEQSQKYYQALKYADASLKLEKEQLKKAKKLIAKFRDECEATNVIPLILDSIAKGQFARHRKMERIIEGKSLEKVK